MNLALWLYRTAQVMGDAPALVLGDRVVADYRTFAARAASLARALAERGVSPGDRVALFMKNCPDYLIVFNAVWTAGAVVVPINAKLHPQRGRLDHRQQRRKAGVRDRCAGRRTWPRSAMCR